MKPSLSPPSLNHQFPSTDETHTASIASSTPSVSLADAIATAEKSLDGQFNQHPATLEFFVKDDGSVVLTHVVQIQNDATGTWVEAFVDAHANVVVSITDFVAKASVTSLLTEATLLSLTLNFWTSISFCPSRRRSSPKASRLSLILKISSPHLMDGTRTVPPAQREWYLSPVSTHII